MRKLLLIAALAAGAALALSGTASAGIAHYWDCNDADGAGGSLADTAGNYVEGTGAPAEDLVPVGNSNTDYIDGRAGAPDRAVKWLSNSVDPYGGGYDSTMTALGNTFTYEAWVQLTAYNWHPTNPNMWAYMTENGGPLTLLKGSPAKGNVFNITVGGNAAVSGTWVLTLGDWYHVAVVADASASTTTVYVTPEGQAGVSFFASGAYDGSSASGGQVFGLGNDDKYCGTGYWDWAAIWDTALTEATLDSHYLDGPGLTPIPEPAGLGLLGVALLAMRKRR